MDLLGDYNSDSDSDDNDTIEQPMAPSQPAAATAASATPNGAMPPSKTNQRGKKLLKLQAVLPSHIWNQLSGGGQTAADDSDEDETPLRATTTPTTTTTTTATTNKTPSTDPDLSNLLQELSKTKGTKGGFLSDAPTGRKRFLSTDEHDPDTTTTIPAPTSSLGQAFTTITSTTTTKKSAVEPEDIHNPHKTETAPTRPIASVPRPTIHSSVPRPVRPTPVPTRPTPAIPVAATAPPPPAAPPQVQRTAAASSRRGRQRLEQQLRAGNVSTALTGNSAVIELQQGMSVNQAVAPPPTAGATASANIQGVRVVPTSQYQVGTGQFSASTQISGRQRGKNQLNALLASAASLEAERTQNPHLNPTANASRHRANAKRKYGW